MGAPFRPATKPRRRDEALAYIIERIVRTGTSPTQEEIGIALDVSKERARQLVDQLVTKGIIERTPGAQRNLRVRDVTQCRAMLDLALRRMGWEVAEPLGSLKPPLSNAQLPMLPPFEHLPDV